MANLFKSVWFRCITCLLAILLFSGCSIAILSDLLYVSPEERTQRGIMKVYGKLVDYETVFDVDNKDYNDSTLTDQQKSLIIYDFGRINKIYKVGNDELLFQSVGYKGFKNGTVTVWVRTKLDEQAISPVYSIIQVKLEANVNQSLINNLGAGYYSNFKLIDVTTTWQNGEFFTADKTQQSAVNYNPVSGATYSANAGNNAVNCVISYLGQGGIA